MIFCCILFTSLCSYVAAIWLPPNLTLRFLHPKATLLKVLSSVGRQQAPLLSRFRFRTSSQNPPTKQPKLVSILRGAFTPCLLGPEQKPGITAGCTTHSANYFLNKAWVLQRPSPSRLVYGSPHLGISGGDHAKQVQASESLGKWGIGRGKQAWECARRAALLLDPTGRGFPHN